MNAETNMLSMTDLQHTALISGNKAMQLLELSRHSFEKVVKEGLLTVIHEGGKKYYQIGEIETFMKTDTYQELVNGVVDARNNLNDLTGKDWLPQTKSFFYQKGLGANHPEAQIEKLHPAPYSFQDIGQLVIFFTKQGIGGKDVFTSLKTRKSKRKIPIPDFLCQELSDYIQSRYMLDADERLFPVTKSYLAHEMIRGCKNTGIKKIRIHDIRHSHASLLINQGCDALMLADRLGHEKVSTTLNAYSHLFPHKQ